MQLTEVTFHTAPGTKWFEVRGTTTEGKPLTFLIEAVDGREARESTLGLLGRVLDLRRCLRFRLLTDEEAPKATPTP